MTCFFISSGETIWFERFLQVFKLWISYTKYWYYAKYRYLSLKNLSPLCTDESLGCVSEVIIHELPWPKETHIKISSPFNCPLLRSLILLRNKNLISPAEIHQLFFQLLRCQVMHFYKNIFKKIIKCH